VTQEIEGSLEFRADAVTGFYNDLLGRQPAPAEVLGWVTRNLDVTQIRLAFLESDEFATNAM
jgi:hypothetical protein